MRGRAIWLLLPLLLLSGCFFSFWGGNREGYGELTLENQRTHERDTFFYRDPSGRLLTEGLSRASWLMRDVNTGQVAPIDPRLLDFMVRVRQTLGLPARAVLVVTSGYRSPQTNAVLRAQTGGVAAEKSYHIRGMAVDLKIPGVSTSRVEDAALSLKMGGVSYYGDTDHVHLDSGPVRTW